MKRIVALLLCTIVLAGVLSACGGASSPKALVKNYASAINGYNAEAFIKCIAPGNRGEWDKKIEKEAQVAEARAMVDDQKVTMNYKKDDICYTNKAKTTAFIEVNVKYGDIDADAIFRIIRINKKWYFVTGTPESTSRDSNGNKVDGYQNIDDLKKSDSYKEFN